MRTTAKVDLLVGNLQFDGHVSWLFSETARANYQIADLLEIFLRILGEQVGTALTTKIVLISGIRASGSLIFADLESYQGTVACRADQGFHYKSPVLNAGLSKRNEVRTIAVSTPSFFLSCSF